MRPDSGLKEPKCVFRVQVHCCEGDQRAERGGEEVLSLKGPLLGSTATVLGLGSERHPGPRLILSTANTKNVKNTKTDGKNEGR